MNDVMIFPERLEDFFKCFSFRDEKEVYTNGSELIQLFRVKQAIEHYCKPVVHAHWVSWRTGEFVPLDKDGSPIKEAVCSNCGDWLTASDEYAVQGYYCPNCGAKMDEKVEE